MGAFATGEVVLLPFPYSDLSDSKVRPALLIADVRRGDWIACQITSNPHADPAAIPLAGEDFLHGGLQRLSFICPGKLFTANESLFTGPKGAINEDIFRRVSHAVIVIIQRRKR